jgi:hypothetical protein
MSSKFAMWILTSRPENLFKGNGFFHDAGDCFSCHYVPPVDVEVFTSNLQSSYPRVDQSVFVRIFKSFDELISLYESGDLMYPYSRKDAISVVKHLQLFPNDDVSTVLHEVLDFDSYYSGQYNIFGNNFTPYGFPFAAYEEWQDRLNKSLNCGRFQFEYTSSVPPVASSSKIGEYVAFV